MGLTIQIPFNSVSELENETNSGTLAPVFYDPAVFQKTQLAAFPTGTVHTHLASLFAGATGFWPCVTNANENPNLNGFFLATQPATGANAASKWSLVISGGVDANGNPLIVDETAFLDSSSGGCPGSCTLAITNLVIGAVSGP
jgi:hypothetical protein